MKKRTWKLFEGKRDCIRLSDGREITLRPGEAVRLRAVMSATWTEETIIGALQMLREEKVVCDGEQTEDDEMDRAGDIAFY